MSPPVEDDLPPDTRPTALAQTDLGPPSLSAVPTTLPGAPSRTGGMDATRYVLGPLIGAGGMGEVRVARDTRMARDVAVKVLRGERDSYETLRLRFLREARIQGRLEHPAIVPVHDLGVDEAGHPFFVMKRLTGLTLGAILARAPGDPELAARWTRRALLTRLVDVCQAVEYAHQRGVVHRDLKPANIMLGDLGEVYVLDWGIARVLRDHGGIDGVHPDDLDTLDGLGEGETGALIGTPGYMSPEQARGEPIDVRADVYALGCLLFELLVGDPAFTRNRDVIAATRAAPAHSPRSRAPEADVPPELDALCVAATAPFAEARLATAGALADGLQRYLDGDRDLERRRELADGFAAAAERELAGVEVSARARAMRQAGRALALDPRHDGAQALIGRLLLEPPDVVPQAVEESIEAERRASGQVHLRSARLAYLAHAPLLLVVGFGSIQVAWPLVAGATLLLVNLTLLFLIGPRLRTGHPVLRVVIAIHAVLIVVTGMIGPSALVLPAMTVSSVVAFTSNPMVKTPRVALGWLFVALLTPSALELLRVVPASVALVDSHVVITPWAVSLSAIAMLGVVAGIAIIQVLGTYAMISQLRRAQERAQAELHLYKWHLEQMLPGRGATATLAPRSPSRPPG